MSFVVANAINANVTATMAAGRGIGVRCDAEGVRD